MNPVNANDVNGDTLVTPLDVLLVINYLNGDHSELPRAIPPFYDTNGDDYISPIDVLIVINFLNGSSVAEGESNASVPTAAWAPIRGVMSPWSSYDSFESGAIQPELFTAKRATYREQRPTDDVSFVSTPLAQDLVFADWQTEDDEMSDGFLDLDLSDVLSGQVCESPARIRLPARTAIRR